MLQHKSFVSSDGSQRSFDDLKVQKERVQFAVQKKDFNTQYRIFSEKEFDQNLAKRIRSTEAQQNGG
jgi:hypothetical protein